MKEFLNRLVPNLVLALIVLVPGTLLTMAQRAVYAGFVFIPLAALIIFIKIFARDFAADSPRFAKLLDICSAILIIIVAHFVLVGFLPANFKYFIIYTIAAIFGIVLGTLVKRLAVDD